jgi:hypothetical protein
MSGPPPADLNDWGKKALVSEVQRLRAVLHEHTQRPAKGDVREGSGADVVDVAGDPHASGGALFDARGSVLLDGMDVLLVDTKGPSDPVNMLMVLKGRVNMTHARVEHGYLFGADGAAAICVEIAGLASRAHHSGTQDGQMFAAEYKLEMERRFEELP